jgi:membrane-associated phospholipid phosphatase
MKTFDTTSWRQRASDRFFMNALLKMVGVSFFMTVFFVVYFEIQNRPGVVFQQMPLTWFDRLVPFEPMALPIYFSLWLYVSLPPGLFSDWRALVRYGASSAALCATGLGCFYLWPTAVPPADVDWTAHPSFAFLKDVDVGGNACPSLHVANAVFACFWLRIQLRELGAGRIARAINALWCVAIVVSTLATRQHVALDVLAGTALGLTWAVISRNWVLSARAAGTRP